MAQATVTLAGTGNVTVHTEDGTTVAEAITAAAEQLGVPAPNLDRVGIVQNGDDVTADRPVQDGDRIAAAPRVANG